ncbi:NADP-dependent oxidoreductase [Pacificimonas sp. WHA3]|uniref:NADP-dependent oxidoreductase n=1 Tax=Pacificimonas pallii TaxID=2827236 RepID=A0ABS6SFK8_9SPHN|nr:NADP-dependent oxidoreductase [Pacificimonas pallii]MBV7257195.1 NADP-dependent oxidoreductase [Pacificimonas pallii]
MTYRYVALARYCDGLPVEDDFAIHEGPVPVPGDGQFRARHIWNSVDPGTRSRLSGSDTYAAAQTLGKPMDGFSVGVIEESKHPDWPEGTQIFFAGGWRTHSILNGKGFIGKVQEAGLPLSTWIGVLGVPGLTAWFGTREIGRFREGDRVLISSAAGPVGATAGQLARAWGASRVVGIAGTAEKCAWLTEEAGFDAAINYKAVDDLDAAIAENMPEGVDLLFDNVGNRMIDRVLPRMRYKGRICVSGQVADYSVAPAERDGIRNTMPFITHQVNMQGLVVFTFAKGFAEALTGMAKMIHAGQLKLKEERFEGLDAMPSAFCGLFRGENFGRRVVRVGDET